ncbi:MAG: translational GTPase TypA [Clostridiales bacterium]|nr:translational GTPase TypA [Clostridiales bacterium]
MIRNDIRNIAIIAHVDHGKTTLVDQMLRQAGVFRQNQQVRERVMDSGDIERERGITILAKNTAVHWGDAKINIVDTPGHADFSGEVERVLKMVDGVLLLTDSFEGPMPQTRFVLKKALDLNLPVLMVINKVDRADARSAEVVDELLDLLIDLEADVEALERPVLFVSARQGTATTDLDVKGTDLKPLFEAILHHIPGPECDPDGPFQTLISTVDYNEYVGRIGVGRIQRGSLRVQEPLVRVNHLKPEVRDTFKVTELSVFDGLKRVNAEEVSAGDIMAISGLEDLNIGDTVCTPAQVESLPFVAIGEPTVSMTFSVNDSPFAGREGTYVTSRHLRARLYKETNTDVSLHVQDGETPDQFIVKGRGELHLSVLIETMRRQGYEFQVSRPEVIYHEENGKKLEPIELLRADVPAVAAGAVIEKLGRRRGILKSMAGQDRVRLEFSVPSRGLFGYRNEFLTDTRGEGIMAAVFEGFEEYRGDIPRRNVGALVCHETGETTQYGLFGAQERGDLFLGAQTPVYAGMICGQTGRPGDIVVNVCRKKHVTNTRNSAAAEDSMRLVSARAMTLEECMEFIDDDELLEVTPVSLRMRKRQLDHALRARAESRAKKA